LPACAGQPSGSSSAAAPPPATMARRRLATTPAPVPAIAPIPAEPSAAPPAAAALTLIAAPAAPAAVMSLGGIVRHEQAQRGAHEGSSGQLYRPTARDGAVGHARGQVVQVRPPMLLGRTADRPVFVSVRQQRDTSFANIALSRLRITPSLVVRRPRRARRRPAPLAACCQSGRPTAAAAPASDTSLPLPCASPQRLLRRLAAQWS
jgi:hypothetical protein